MTRARPRAAVLGGSAEDIEAAFYEAQQHGDIEQLMSCWAQDEEVVCVHPDGLRLLGTGAIRAASESIFSPGVVRANPLPVHRVLALAGAVHSVVEPLEITLPDGVHQALIMAPNVYHNTPEGWRMVAHHASPGGAQDTQDLSAGRPVLH